MFSTEIHKSPLCENVCTKTEKFISQANFQMASFNTGFLITSLSFHKLLMKINHKLFPVFSKEATSISKFPEFSADHVVFSLFLIIIIFSFFWGGVGGRAARGPVLFEEQ